MQFQIRNRWTGDVQYACEMTAEVAGLAYSLQLGWAIRKALAEKANLRAANLRDANLRDADLSDADLREADLSDANLSAANLRAANLRDANLSDADLSDADLRAADGTSWIPRIENIHQAVYEAASKPEALDMSVWHRGGYCGTTHCRAGWVVVLAGAGGRVLEGVYGTPAAAALIYQASDPSLTKVPDFYAYNEDALADMKRLAEAEASKA